MKSFKTFIEQQFFVESLINEFDSPTQKWSAKKDQIVDTWKNLRSNVPIYMTPISPNNQSEGDNKSYGEDGIRISGSWQFIASVLGRMKDLLQYENEQTRLRLVFKGVDTGDENKQTFVFYINSEERKKKGT